MTPRSPSRCWSPPASSPASRCSPRTPSATVGALAGHSVGELTAAGLSGALTAEEAVRLVRERGEAMAEAAAATPTSMTAVLGGDRDEVLAAIAKQGLTAANDNGPGQIVAAGTVEQLAAFAEEPPTRARLIPLSVAGAFHTEHMAPAVARVEALAASVTPQDPRTRVISNADGQVVDRWEPTYSPGSSRRSAGRSAGTCAWRRCSGSASPVSSSCRRPAP